MFKGLQNKLLLIHMLLISFVMIAAFSSIYFTMYKSIQANNQDKLNNVVFSYDITIAGDFEESKKENDSVYNSIQEDIFFYKDGTYFGNFDVEESTIPSDHVENDIEKTEIIGNMNNDEHMPQSIYVTVTSKYSLSFTMETDKEGNILVINSIIDMPKESYEEIAKKALNHKGRNSIIEHNGIKWQYSILPNEFSFYDNNNQLIFNGTESDKYQLSFLDVTESYETLHNLMITFILVGLIMFVVIFLISLYFSNRAIRPIAKTWEKQQQFIADASHELKTPLTIIQSNYDALLEEQDGISEHQLEWLEYIKVGIDRMSSLIHNLLMLANMDNNNMPCQMEDFNISQTIEDLIQSMKARMLSKDLKLSMQIDPDIIINSDQDKVIQIISILLDNAIKYTNSRGMIDVTLTKSKRHLYFKIKNSGNGISKEDLPKLFDRFFRADLSRTGSKMDGYGLGLSIAKMLAEQLGGIITADSIENETTIFTFILNRLLN